MKRFNNVYQGSPNKEVLSIYNEASKLLNLSKSLDRLMLKLNKSMLSEVNNESFYELLDEKTQWAQECIDNRINDFIDSYKVYMTLVRQVYFIKQDCNKVFTKLEKTNHLDNLSKADKLRQTQAKEYLKEVMLGLGRTPLIESNIYDSNGSIRYVEYLHKLIRFYISNNSTYLDLNRLVLDEVVMPLKYLDLITSLFSEDTSVTFVIRTDYGQYSTETCNLSELHSDNDVISFTNNSIQYIKFCDSYFMYRYGTLYGEVLGFY